MNGATFLPMEKSVDPRFFEEIKALGKEIRQDTSADDLQHLKKIETWGRVFSFVGYATSWMGIKSLCLLE